MMLPRLGLGRRSVDHQGLGQRKPNIAVRGQSSVYAVQVPTYDTNVPVDIRYPFVRSRLQQLAGNDLFYCQDDAIFTSYAYTCASIFNRLDGILDLCGNR